VSARAKWFALTVFVCVVAVTFILWNALRKVGEFAFLGNAVPVDSELNEDETRTNYYSFKADFTDVVALAKVELRGQGYTFARRSDGRAVVFEKTTGRDIVVIYRKTRWRKPTVGFPRTEMDLAWITVIVTRPEEKSLADRTREWLGL
jgi:hypothetical protein